MARFFIDRPIFAWVLAIASHLQAPVSRAPGCGSFQLFGAQYAMRIWLDPAKLDNYGLTPLDVANAVKAQNVQVAAAR